MRLVLVRGVGDVGSAISHVLWHAGYALVIHDSSAPTTTRRGMAFADAVFDGTVALEGVTARLADNSHTLKEIMDRRAEIPVVIWNFENLIAQLSPDVLVDARMRKREDPEVQLGLAPLTIGLGPNFIAGKTTDLVIETNWGKRLGDIVREGSATPLAGEPRAISGLGRERFVYASKPGVFHTCFDIGDLVECAQEIARIGDTPLFAPLSGMIRGVTRDGIPVSIGTKVIEIDPRGPAAVTRGLGERPRRIAAGVLKAVTEREDQ